MCIHPCGAGVQTLPFVQALNASAFFLVIILFNKGTVQMSTCHSVKQPTSEAQAPPGLWCIGMQINVSMHLQEATMALQHLAAHHAALQQFVASAFLANGRDPSRQPQQLPVVR